MSMARTQAPRSAFRYLRGPSGARRHARVDTKPTYVKRETRDADGRIQAVTDTGGGYERIRSNERDPRAPSDGAGDVYVSHHRLLAVAWAIAFHPDADADGRIIDPDHEGVVDMAALDGIDIHHDAPELGGERGVEWDNREACLYAIEHGAHSGLTNAEKRAYAEDAKRLRDGDERLPTSDGCAGCGAEPDATVAGDRYCLECATDAASGTDETIEVL
jgi:hypothetical protein